MAVNRYHSFFNQSNDTFAASHNHSQQNRNKNLLVPFIDPCELPESGKLLGEGIYGIVYLAQWNNQMVAIKKVINNYNLNWLITCNNEKDIMQLLSFYQVPNIVGFFAYSFSYAGINSAYYVKHGTDAYFYVTEYMSRGSLDQQLAAPELASWDLCRYIIKNIAIALVYLHNLGIGHGDIKPANILLNDSWQAKLADFGFAKILDGNPSNVGSPYWLAPEFFSKFIHTEKTDIYSFAIVMWQLASKKQIPFSWIKTFPELRKAIQNGTREIIPNKCPKDIARYIRWGWAKNPEKRPTAGSLLEAINQVQAKQDQAVQSHNTELKLTKG